ncbi:hypothetical protein NL676_018191 [Syzygium grande]|nr:hypothetical protein NL676_018191 [Syzygium grande]
MARNGAERGGPGSSRGDSASGKDNSVRASRPKRGEEAQERVREGRPVELAAVSRPGLEGVVQRLAGLEGGAAQRVAA